MPKNVTLKDIAKEAGVSTALVSFVMNNRLEASGRQKYRVGEKTRQHILEVARRLNYRPAKRILQRELRPRVVAVLLPRMQEMEEFSMELERLCAAQGCTLLFGYTLDDPQRLQRLLGTFLERKVDGVVLPSQPEEDLEGLLGSGIPYVVPELSGEAIPAARECASRLLQLLEENE